MEVANANILDGLNDTPSNFLHEIGPGITPVITSHGDVNFFEKSFERAMADGSEKLPSLKGLPGLNSKLKLNSIQLISPPSDSSTMGSVNTAPEFNINQSKRRRSADQHPALGPGVRLLPESLSESAEIHPKSIAMVSSSVLAGQGLYRPPQTMMAPQPMMPMYMDSNLGSSAASKVQSSGSLNGGMHSVMPLEPAGNQLWANSIQQAKASTMEKQMRFQEKNRIAAMKSRQRKKQEWERLQVSEKSLLEENRSLKERIAVLEGEIRVLRESQSGRRQ